MNSTYSTAELANLLNVNESTIKRWSDTGDLVCIKTKGGHRKFFVGDVMAFIRRNKLTASAESLAPLANENLQAHVMIGNIGKLVPELKKEMMEGNVPGVLRILRIAYVARPKLLDLFSELVFPPLVELGEEWRRKIISVDQEHLGSNALREALAQFHADIHCRESNGLKALCACPEGEWHDIAIKCIGYFLESEGWGVLFLGQSSPIDSLVDAIKSHKPNLVILSAVTVGHGRPFLRAVNKSIYPACRRAKARLAIGGPGMKDRWKEKIKAEHLCETINDCEAFADPTLYTTKR